MPTYHYVCPKCDHEFELFEKMISDLPKTRKCPACGGRARRQISGGAGFLFKGEGFYQTDYRSAEYQSRAKADEETGTPEKKPDTKSTEAPPEKSSDDKGE